MLLFSGVNADRGRQNEAKRKMNIKQLAEERFKAIRNERRKGNNREPNTVPPGYETSRKSHTTYGGNKREGILPEISKNKRKSQRRKKHDEEVFEVRIFRIFGLF